MGTRADFYVGKGKEAEWIGSIAFDGYRSGIDAQILQCQSPEAFRHAVKDFMDGRDDATYPEQGWPWPWEDSGTSDCSYWFFDGQTWDEHRRGGYPGTQVYVPVSRAQPTGDEEDEDKAEAAFTEGCEPIAFPNMKDKQNVTMGHRSGLLVITAR